MTRVFTLTCLVSLFLLPCQAQESDSLVSSQQVIRVLKTLPTSFSGNAENCIPYDVYAFKYKKTWILALVESENVEAFIVRGPRTDQSPYLASRFMSVGMSLIVPNKYYYIQKNRRKVINDIETYPFYKLKRKGKKAMKGLLYLELPDPKVRPSFFLWKIFAKKREEIEATPSGLKEGFDQSINGTNEELEQAGDQLLEIPNAAEEVGGAVEEKKGFLFFGGK
ncbi:hypothetical protein N7E81_10210 [Reichenbachiella carrageenanivorans]|uniref:DUF4384 domain-containing protein n=1 Tax=Reichenbachiella carrageenanivorans TaxID=2979869 RepID=A0ABY6CUY5_9BACT|nr:hypothetical protein [Reichenbachiella carrageenanivorans]UXX77742.1 hypothetical protein N7E81_10210 [Reichenbachiella carrageenanivorans]